MSVTGSGVRLLFCEGQPNSLDIRLMQRLVLGKPPTILIIPAGGKHGIRAYAGGRLSAYEHSPTYLIFRDRDFDVEPTEDVEPIRLQEAKPVFASHRAAIENYLIDSELIHQYWGEFSKSPGWKHGQSPGTDKIRLWINKAAGKIANYQALRWALASLKPTKRWPELRTTWTKGSGYLPASLDQDKCVAEAKKLVDEYASALGGVSENELLASYERFRKKFELPDFIDEGEFLVWFHGKDLLKAMQKARQNAISTKHFSSWAVDNVDWERYADLKLLATMI